MNQLITPNLDPTITQGGKVLTDWLGWCLAYVQFAYNVGWSGATALDAWNRNSQFNHTDKNIPENVYVPIFFNGYSNMGHTAIVKWSGGTWEMWSSPISHKPYADYWKSNSLDGLISIIKTKYSSTCNYLGWSSGLNGKQIIGGSMEIFNEGDRFNINHWLYGQDLGIHGDQIGKTYKDGCAGIFTGTDYNFHHKVNDGDIANINAATGADSGIAKDYVWKRFWYEWADPQFRIIRSQLTTANNSIDELNKAIKIKDNEITRLNETNKKLAIEVENLTKKLSETKTVEVEPKWLVTVRDAILTFLKIKKG